MTKTKLLLAGSLVAFAAGCSDDVALDSREESKTAADVVLHVAGAVDGALLDGVRVVDMGTNAKQTTKNGRADFDGLSNGDHAFLFSLDGYATVLVDYSVNLDGAIASLPIERDDARVIRMHRMGAQAFGLVKYRLSDGQLVKAPGISVKLDVSGEASGRFMPSYYEATTDSNGRFLFDDLPELSLWSATVANPVLDGDLVWRADTVFGKNVVRDQLEDLHEIVLSLDAGRAEIDSVTWTLGQKDSFVFHFSDPVDLTRAKLDKKSVVLKNLDESSEEIGVALSWSEDARTLTVSPASGAWEITERYRFSLNLTSVQGKKFPAAYEFHVDNTASVGKITGLKVVSALSVNDNPSWNGVEDDPCIEDSTATIVLTFTPPKNHVRAVDFFTAADNDLYFYNAAAADGDTAVVLTLDGRNALKPNQKAVNVAARPANDATGLALDKKFTLPICE